MSGNTTAGSVKEALGSLSGDRAKLLELLLEKRSSETQAIRSYARTAGENRLPVSWAQERLWFIDQLEGAGAAYNEFVAVRLAGKLGQEALKSALDALVMRHEVLRTTFVSEAGVPKQRIAAAGSFALRVIDLRAYAPAERDLQLHSHTFEEVEQPFDLSTGPLIRGLLLRTASDHHLLIITMHHVISDGWSNGILAREASELYNACLDGRPSRLPPLPIQYADYSQWQRDWVRAELAQNQLSYWCTRLKDVPPQLDMPSDRPRRAAFRYRGGNMPVVIGAQLSDELRKLARGHGVTLFMLLYAGWATLLSRLSGQRDIVIGTPLANRRRLELEGLIGFFVNTLPLRIDVTDNTPFEEFLARVKETTLAAYDNQDVPFEQIVERVRPPRSLSRHPIFQVVFALQSAPRSDWNLSGLTATKDEIGNETAKFDLVLSLEEHGEEIRGAVNYDSDLFDRATISRWMDGFAALLTSMANDPTRRLGELRILSEQERQLVIERFNATRMHPREKLIHEIFEEQVERTPDALAVTYEGHGLTYSELNARANQLANYLERRGVQPGEYIPILMLRSLDMLIAQLAVIKAAAVYVPMDPLMPRERLALMVRDCGARWIITEREIHADLANDSMQVINCTDLESAIALCSRRNPIRRAFEQPAYVMYTSGSTGVPKGVAVPHRAVNRLCINNGYAEIEPTDCIAHYSNPAFDASTFEVWGALLTGARVLIVPQHVVLEPRRFAEVLSSHRVTILWMTVGLFAQYTDVLANVFRGLKYLLVGGDTVDPELVSRVLRNGPPRHFLNAYGPTECTTFSTIYPVDAVDENAGSLPIGRPISNTRIYVLDRYLRPVPIGVTGDIYIGGDGVALGYLNRPELTAERFIADPFGADAGGRLYKSGDLGRWRSDGNLEFLGRIDQQVKIRGFRIEPGEIEVRLARHPQVDEAVVVVREDVPGDKRLVAYVVPRDRRERPTTLSAELLRAHVKAALPDYMVPSAFVMLDRLPLTENGKVDRRALPAPAIEAYASRRYESPRGELEEILAGIWQALLQVERVGRQDNFFELGGHSLLIVQMMERLRQRGLSADVRSIYESPTLAELANTLERGVVDDSAVPPNLIPAECMAITPQMLTLIQLDEQQIATIVRAIPGGARNIQDIYPLAPLQEGILFHHLLDSGRGDTYVLPRAFSIVSRKRLDELIAALQVVIDRHDIMRTAILWEGLSRPVQVVCRRAALQVVQLELDRNGDPAVQAEEWVRPERQTFDLRQAPLLRLQIAPTQSGQWIVLLQLHHIVIDHVAIETLTAEVVAHLEGRGLQLPESAPYRNHVARVLAHTRARNSEEFFRGKLADVDEPTAPFGLLDVHRDGTQIEDACEELEPVLAQRVRAQAQRLGLSAATMFHAGWALVLACTTGRDDVVFGSVLLGRLQGSAGMQHTLGMFINTLPLRLRLRDATARTLVSQTQRELVELLGHEHASLSAAQRCSGVAGSTPLFSTLLNFRHSVPNAQAQWARASGIQVIASLERTNYPVTLSVDDLGEGFRLKAQTDRNIDPRRVTGYLRTALESLVEALEQRPDTKAMELSILPDHERQQVIESFNSRSRAINGTVLVHELFEEQVRRTPDAVAVVHDPRALTYRELNLQANQLAVYLRVRGIAANELVGICLERSSEMIVALLGIMKAGAAYVPLDPSYPPERIQYMLSDAAPRLVITQKHLRVALPTESIEVLDLSEQPQQGAGNGAGDVSVTQLGLSSDNLVYVIYTSGSTGQPKGITMPHRAMVNLLEWHRNTFGQGEGRRVLQFAALGFDVAFQEISSTLCTGGTLVLLDEWVRRDASALIELLNVNSIERLFVPPLMLQSLAEQFRSAGLAPISVRDVIVAGEQLRISPEIIELFRTLDRCRLHNHYGPTETHVVTALTLPEDPDEWPALPTIGSPISNTQIYILDDRHRPVPIGVPGEIYIAGANVALGYLNRVDLTEKRFLANPFSRDATSRMYKTGDVGRWRADGAIEYLGRNDDQVKIRGFRVELGEIEAHLARCATVREAAVIAREGSAGEKRLLAYVIPRDENLSVDDLRAHLKGALPEYMVPSAFVVLDKFPLTPTGKLDRRSLPAAGLSDYSAGELEPPQGKVEERIASIWQEVLQVGQVGRRDDFFALGGHSLLVLKVLTRINQSLGCALKVRDLYKSPTLQELAARVSGAAVGDDLVDLAREALLDRALMPLAGRPSMPERAIILTGATGFVGRFLLVQLLQDTDARIHCLVRARLPEEAQARLRATLVQWGLWRDNFASRLVAVPGDLRLPRLGIDERTYRTLSENVDSIYHCATSMNHLETYQMAKAANVDSAGELLTLAVSVRPKLVNYVSTLGIFTAPRLDRKRLIAEDNSIDHETYRNSQGYLASKWVSDKIFMLAQQRGVPCNIFRLGLVWADTQEGRFDEQQNVYMVLKSCLLSGYAIKNYQYPMPPTPVDYVARAITYLGRSHTAGQGIFHISSSRQAIEGVFESCNTITDRPLELVPQYQWICEMKRLHREGQSLPAVPLIEYAFDMDEDSFHRHECDKRSVVNVHFDLARTNRALEVAGIVMPVLNDELLSVCLNGMLSRDAELQEMMKQSRGTRRSFDVARSDRRSQA